MATAKISLDQDAVEAEIFVAAPVERVFQAITDPNQLSRWWGQAGLYKITQASSDVRKGGKFASIGWKSIRQACSCIPGVRVMAGRHKPSFGGSSSRATCMVCSRRDLGGWALAPW